MAVAAGSYLPYVQQLQGQGTQIEITPACDVEEARREPMRQRFGIETFSTQYEDVINSPEVDVVLVLTSMPQHGTITRAALESGKHVMVVESDVRGTAFVESQCGVRRGCGLFSFVTVGRG